MRPSTYSSPGLGGKMNGQIDACIKRIKSPNKRPKDDQVQTVEKKYKAKKPRREE